MNLRVNVARIAFEYDNLGGIHPIIQDHLDMLTMETLRIVGSIPFEVEHFALAKTRATSTLGINAFVIVNTLDEAKRLLKQCSGYPLIVDRLKQFPGMEQFVALI